VTARVEPEAITIGVRTAQPWSVESENFDRKRDMLEFTAKRRVICSDRL
jgi:hypothetical protein